MKMFDQANLSLSPVKTSVIGVDIDSFSWDETLALIHQWSSQSVARYVCIVNVHSIITSRSNPQLQAALDEADLCTPDGAPVAWMISLIRNRVQARINGPDLMLKYIQAYGSSSDSMFFLGSSNNTLIELASRFTKEVPSINIAGMYSPPFKEFCEDDVTAMINKINSSGASIVWVSFGCPKQEIWMHRCKDRVNAVMIGVGAAFDYHSGQISRAPKTLRSLGLEWAFRLLQEPRRLWRRYLFTNTHFVLLALKQIACVFFERFKQRRFF